MLLIGHIWIFVRIILITGLFLFIGYIFFLFFVFWFAGFIFGKFFGRNVILILWKRLLKWGNRESNRITNLFIVLNSIFLFWKQYFLLFLISHRHDSMVTWKNTHTHKLSEVRNCENNTDDLPLVLKPASMNELTFLWKNKSTLGKKTSRRKIIKIHMRLKQKWMPIGEAWRLIKDSRFSKIKSNKRCVYDDGATYQEIWPQTQTCQENLQ